MNGSHTIARGLVVTAVSIAALMLSAQFKVSWPGLSVPFTLQTLVLLLIGTYVRPWNRSVSIVSLYIFMGLLGFPAFASAPNSLDMFFSSSAGYLLGFVLAALIIGRFVDKVTPVIFLYLAGHIIILFAGVIGLCINRQLPVMIAISVGVIPFIPGAVIKSVLGWIIYIGINKFAQKNNS